MENDLKEIMVAVERYLSFRIRRPTDTSPAISSTQTEYWKSQISDNDKLELADLGSALEVFTIPMAISDGVGRVRCAAYGSPTRQA